MEKYYTIYDNATDEILAFGTAEQCVIKLNMKNKRSFFSMVSHSKSGKIKKYKVVVDDSEE